MDQHKHKNWEKEVHAFNSNNTYTNILNGKLNKSLNIYNICIYN